MIISTITASNCTPQTIVIGRRGTYDTMQIAFDLSFLTENYGSGTAVLAVKRSQDESAYPAVVTQEDNILTWTVSETDTAYVGSGECQLMWYVDGGLAKTIIYPMVVMRDILSTAEEPPDGYENWIEHLTDLGAETQQNAQNAAQSASEAEQAKDDAVDAKEASEEAARKAAEASVHAPIIQNGYWYIWNDGQYVDTGVRAEGQKGDKGDTGEKGDTGNGIESITKTGTSGLVDTYTVTYTDGTTTTFTVTNGAKGDKGDAGATGNGIQSITKTGTSGNVDTYTITYTNGQTTTFTVTNGAVTSVAGKTGAVVLDSGDIGYDSTETYTSGTVGAELDDLTRQISDVEENQIPELKNAISQIEDYTNNQLTNNILSEYDDNFPLKNTYINKKGNLVGNSPPWNTSDYIPIKPNTYYRLSAIPAGGWFLCAYDANKTRIAGIEGYQSTGLGTGPAWHYLRISLTNAVINAGVKFFEGSMLANYGKTAYNNCGAVLTVGTGRMYERLRDAVSDARRLPAAKIVVYPGTYDLTSEFASELASGGEDGILLTGNLHLLFLQGAYVTCEFTDRSHEEFSPFYVAYPTNDYSIMSSNITLEGLNMTAKNCRYCVHDEMMTRTLPYIHKYINCNMKFTCDLTSPKYVQCIGGGLGVSGNIVVDGGVYSVDTLYGYTSVGGDGQNSQQCITYHNSSAATAKSNIRVSNVLLKDRGYFRFSNYGSSTEKTVVCVSGCKTGMPTLQKRENSTEAGDNIELNEWNEEHTVQGHWELTNAYTAQFVPDA